MELDSKHPVRIKLRQLYQPEGFELAQYKIIVDSKDLHEPFQGILKIQG